MKNGKRDEPPHEIERKLLIEMPDEQALTQLEICSRTEIVQIYLKINENGARRRIRKRGCEADGWKYYYTEKTDVAFGERIEIEREIEKSEYEELKSQADTTREPIEKTRICFNYGGLMFELDIYPFSDKYATLEAELDDINQEMQIPPYIKVLRDVTGDKRYENASLAASRRLDL